MTNCLISFRGILLGLKLAATIISGDSRRRVRYTNMYVYCNLGKSAELGSIPELNGN